MKRESPKTPRELSITLEDAAKELKQPLDVVAALALSGLLSLVRQRRISRDSLESFKKYGTQWGGRIGKRPAPFERLPVVESTGPQPPSTWTHVRIGRQVVRADDDSHWIAHFYLRPNEYYFPDPEAWAPVGPPPLRVNGPLIVESNKGRVWLYPHPDGSLALLAASGAIAEDCDPLHVGYDLVTPVLDELAVRYDKPLRICQSMWVGIPSGTLNMQVPNRTPQDELDPDLGWTQHEPLDDAMALYRMAIAAQDPFQQFLGLWRVQENVRGALSEWCERTGRSAVKPFEERMPDVFAWSSRKGHRFGRVLEELNKPYRVALAHGFVAKGKRPRSGARADDHFGVASRLPALRYIARVLLLNFRATLESGGVKRAGTEAQGRG